jgi:quercetin dioxygenase-like cupin family protein
LQPAQVAEAVNRLRGGSLEDDRGNWDKKEPIFQFLASIQNVQLPQEKNVGNQERFTNLVFQRDREVLEVFGPNLQFMVAPQSSDEAPCVIKGTIPSGVSVPIHSHEGVEAFFVISGDIQVLSEAGGDAHWITARPGDFIEVPSKAKHAFRNSSQHPVVQLITMTSKLGRFFQEVGRPINQGATVSPPLPDELQRFLKTAERYGYWLATPEENALVGISLF